jgi:hypothetical protein
MPSIDIGLFVDELGCVRSDVLSHEAVDRYLERRDGEALDAFRARLAETHAAFDRDREMKIRVQREYCDEAEAMVIAADEVLEAAECDLLEVSPTSLKGLVALMRYAHAYEAQTNSWPGEWSDDDGNTVDFLALLFRRCADALEAIVNQTA